MRPITMITAFPRSDHCYWSIFHCNARVVFTQGNNYIDIIVGEWSSNKVSGLKYSENIYSHIL